MKGVLSVAGILCKLVKDEVSRKAQDERSMKGVETKVVEMTSE